jgi:hypothetical protein
MITPKEIREKSDKLFNKVVCAVLKEQDVFPLIIPANKKISGTNFSELRTAIVPIYQQSKECKGKGYTVEWIEKTVEGTKQKIPAKFYFETLDDYLFYTNRTKDYSAVKDSFEILTNTFPELKDWAAGNVQFLCDHANNINDLIKVCGYFQQTDPPHKLYLRELPIEVHSKFIEDNTSALRKLLDRLLPPEWVNEKETEFASRYYIKKPHIYTHIRILDDDLKPAVGFDDLTLSLDNSALINWQPQRVFIIENKACFLSFPKVKNAVAVFGEGFKSRISKHIPWLAKAQLFCWFDLDAAGFEMLNIIRQYYPDAKSFLMDELTYKQFEHFSVTSSYRKLLLDNLTTDELRLYVFLQLNNKRLEQERIPNHYIYDHLPW